MQRRHLLHALGGTIAIGLAGCLGEPGGPTTESESTPTRTTPRRDGDWDPGASEPFQSVTIGTRTDVDFPNNNRPPEIRIWNDAATAREVTMTLRTPESVRMATTVEFPADGWLRMVVNEPGTYTLEIDIEGERADEIEVTGWFDCNETTSRVTLHPDGELSTRTVSTEIACRGPEVRGQTFSAERGSCDGSEDASVTFDDEAVTVTGRVRTPTPCYDLELASATVANDAEFGPSGDDVLVVTVATAGTQDEACVDCIGSVPYTATIDVANAYPSNVRVVHRSMGEERTVETVSRGR